MEACDKYCFETVGENTSADIIDVPSLFWAPLIVFVAIAAVL